jgi:RNA-directed DNA polymerase
VKQTRTSIPLDTKLNRISEISRKDPQREMKWLMPHFTTKNLKACFHELDGKKAVGVDKVSKEEYAKNLEANLESLVSRLKQMSYRPQPARQVLIPKASGGMRPLGIATVEDKIVQSLTAKILEATYEPIFSNDSYGFRPGRNCHQAISATSNFLFQCSGPVTVLEIDFSNFFGTIDHEKLVALLGMRIKDNRFLRYIVRMLKSGILTDEGLTKSTVGTPQGSICSPILANVFAHYAVDSWFKSTAKPLLAGVSGMVRYADDAVFLFTSGTDAECFEKALRGRVERFGLTLNEEKTKSMTLDKSAMRRGQRQPTFSFLGFTFYLGRSKKGYIVPMIRTDRVKMRKKLKEVSLWVKMSHHNHSMLDLWKHLRVILRGYQEYFMVNYNQRSVRILAWVPEPGQFEV